MPKGDSAKGVSTEEAIQSLVDQVAQLRADNYQLNKQLSECRQMGTVSPVIDSAAAALVTPFSGKPGEDIFSFFDDLASAAKLGLWTDDQLLQMTKLRLTGEAKNHVLYNEQLRNAMTFDELKKGLLQRFQKQNSSRFFREQLNAMSMKQNETIENFVDRIRRINANTYQLTDSDEANKIILQEAERRALDVFLRGLPADLSRRVRAEFPETLAEAVTRATAFVEIDTVTRARERRNVFSTRCFRCDRQGHIARNCNVPQCRFCHRVGHLDRDCRAKRDSDRRRPLNDKGSPRAAVSGSR